MEIIFLYFVMKTVPIEQNRGKQKIQECDANEQERYVSSF